MRARDVFVCTPHGIICLRSPSDTASHSANDLDQLKSHRAISGNYVQSSNHEALGAVPHSKCKSQSTHTAVETFLASQAAAPQRFSSFFYLLWGKRGSFHSLLCSLPQTAIGASRFSQLLNGKQHPSKLTLTLRVQSQLLLPEQNK